MGLRRVKSCCALMVASMLSQLLLTIPWLLIFLHLYCREQLVDLCLLQKKLMLVFQYAHLMHIQWSLLIESDVIDLTGSHTFLMPQRKLLMLWQNNMCLAIGNSRHQTVLNLSKNIASHYRLTLIFCCGQVRACKIDYDHYPRPLNPDLYWCKWIRWILYTVESREPLPSDIHNLDCSQSCICCWQGLGEGVGAEDVLLAATPIGG